jgi:ATP-dependent DNA ligase
MVRQIQPMLAAEPKSKGKVDQAYIERIMSDPQWVAEEKYDGARYLAHFEADRVYFTSRYTSVKTGQLVEKGENVPHLNKAVKELVGTVLDGEITTGWRSSDVTSIMGSLPEEAIRKQEEGGYVRYRVWDILFYKGRCVMDKPWGFRQTLTHYAVEEWRKAKPSSPGVYVTHVVSVRDDKKQFLEQIWERGGEGIILKHQESPYVPDARKKEYWVKVKMHQTFDVVIMGFTKPEKWTTNVKGEKVINKHYEKGLIAAIRYGQYVNGKLVEIGQCSGMNEETRENFTRLAEHYMQRKTPVVIEVKAQEQLKSGALRHPRFVRIREDKNPKDCKLEVK